MSKLLISPVVSARERRVFLTFPWLVYKNDPLWVPPLLPDRSKTIDPQRGLFFKRGEADFFISWKDDKPVGTICVAEDRVANQLRDKQECLFGFFEYIQDQKVFEALLQQAIQWAESHQLNTLYGPYNLDYEDSYGVLIEGRERPPAIMCGHSPTYYQEFMESYGFTPAHGDNLAYSFSVKQTPSLERLSRLAERIRQRGHIYVRGADLIHWDDEVDRVYLLINAALSHLPDHNPWQREVLYAMLAPFRRIVDPELVLFAEVDGKTVGWFPGIPNLNEALIHVNGLRYPWDYAKLWWYTRRQPDSLAIKSVLVLPEYWHTGVSVLLFDEMAKRAIAKGYKWADLSLTSDDNPNTPILAEHMDAKIYKRYRIYRLQI